MRPPGALRCAPVFCYDGEEFEQLGIAGRSGVPLEWTVFGNHAEAQEPIGFRERRVLPPPSTTHSSWTVERRYPNTRTTRRRMSGTR